MDIEFQRWGTYPVVDLAVELFLGLSIYSFVLIFGEKFVSNQSKGGICGLG
jgi:hypothetical protein